MDKKEIFKKYVELFIKLEKAMIPYDEVLGDMWRESIDDATWDIEKFLKELIGLESDIDTWQCGMISDFIFTEARKEDNRITLDELADVIYMTNEEFGAWYEKNYPAIEE